MSNKVATWDVRNLTTNFLGIDISDGLEEDSFIKISPPEIFGEVQGPDGNVIRFKRGDRLYGIEITLMASSDHNATLTAIHAGDAAASGGAGIGSLFIKDNNGLSGSSIYASAAAWIMQAPEVELTTEPKPRVWIIRAVADPVTMFTGGL